MIRAIIFEVAIVSIIVCGGIKIWKQGDARRKMLVEEEDTKDKPDKPI